MAAHREHNENHCTAHFRIVRMVNCCVMCMSPQLERLEKNAVGILTLPEGPVVASQLFSIPPRCVWSRGARGAEERLGLNSDRFLCGLSGDSSLVGVPCIQLPPSPMRGHSITTHPRSELRNQVYQNGLRGEDILR